MHKTFRVLGLLAALALAPGVQAEPGLPAPALAAAPPQQPASPARAWWLSLGDPQLAELIQRGLDANFDLAQAQARVRRARAMRSASEAAFGPSAGLALQARAAQASEAEAPGASRIQRRSDTVGLALELSWEVDLFGRLQAQAGAAGERVAASEAEAEGMRLAISAEIAHAWFSLSGAREQLEIARTAAANRERTAALVAARVRHGLAPPLDLARARADLEAVRAEIPLQEAAVRQASHRIAVLLAQPPAGFELPVAAPGPATVVTMSLAEPSAWLSQRPDIREMEAQLRAKALDVSAVRAEFYPRLTLGGVLGFVAGSASAIGSAGTLSWLGAPSLLAPLLDRPRIAARLEAARAGHDEALAGYRQRLLLAAEEVENALAGYAAGQARFDALQRRTVQAAEAERLARRRHEAGGADLLELLDAQRSLLQAEVALSAAAVQQRQNLVALLKAMGGT